MGGGRRTRRGAVSGRMVFGGVFAAVGIGLAAVSWGMFIDKEDRRPSALRMGDGPGGGPGGGEERVEDDDGARGGGAGGAQREVAREREPVDLAPFELAEGRTVEETLSELRASAGSAARRSGEITALGARAQDRLASDAALALQGYMATNREAVREAFRALGAAYEEPEEGVEIDDGGGEIGALLAALTLDLSRVEIQKGGARDNPAMMRSPLLPPEEGEDEEPRRRATMAFSTDGFEDAQNDSSLSAVTIRTPALPEGAERPVDLALEMAWNPSANGGQGAWQPRNIRIEAEDGEQLRDLARRAGFGRGG